MENVYFGLARASIHGLTANRFSIKYMHVAVEPKARSEFFNFPCINAHVNAIVDNRQITNIYVCVCVCVYLGVRGLT